MTTTRTTEQPSRQVFNSLNGLRFLLSVWIAYFHVGHMFDETGFGAIPILELGIARVDIFFALSGFVLAHVYWATRTKPFDFADFMAGRLARIYPMYLIALALIGTYLIIGVALGKSPETAYPVSDLIKSFFFLQAFGLTSTNSWNFPAWAVAAEMGGYIAFPLFLWIANRLRQRPWTMLALAIAIVAAVELFLRTLFDMPMNMTTTDWGALRGGSVIFCGVAARVAFDSFKPSPVAAIGILFSGAILVGAAALNEWGVPFVVLGGVAIIASFARLDAQGVGTPLSTPLMVRLGDWAYVIFILHAPIYTITVHGLDLLGFEFVATPLSALWMTLLVIAVSGPIYHLIEKPARARLRQAWQNFRGHRIANAGL